MSRAGLTPEQNEHVRSLIRDLLARPGETQSSLAPKLGMTQPGLSSFLSGRSGTTYVTVQRISKLLKVPPWKVLGEPPPRVPAEDPRQLAAELAREIGVSERAIADVLAEPLTPETENWRALWWADRMRRRDLDLLSGPPTPAGPARGPEGPTEQRPRRSTRR